MKQKIIKNLSAAVTLLVHYEILTIEEVNEAIGDKKKDELLDSLYKLFNSKYQEGVSK